ncbi:MAG: class I adenylate-forming enzyme family protein [Rhizobiaceae bacterium]
MNLGWWLERSWWDFADKVAVVDPDDTQVTYDGLRSLTNRMGNVLRHEGMVGPDDVVVTVMADHHIHVATLFAVWRLGAVFCGLNRQLPPEQLVADAKRTFAKVVIVDDALGHLCAGFAEAGLKVYRARTDADGVPAILPLTHRHSDALEVAPRGQADTACINFTSGTSGQSKGVIFTHGTLGNSALGSIFLAGVKSDTRNLSIVGMFHSGGVHDSLRLVAAGATILWSDGWDVGRVVHIFETHAPNFMYWIGPTPLRQLIAHPAWPTLNLRGMRMYIAGEVVPPEMERAVQEKGAIVGKIYGLTEAMPVCILSTSLYYGGAENAPATSSGKPNREFCDVVLKDPYTGELVEGGGVEGEICVRGDVITPGYFNDAEKTREAFDADGYLHTKDLAYRDAEGWYHIRGRADDVISVSGKKVSLLDIDRALLKGSGVLDAACVGVRHLSLGEAPAAFVVLQPGASESAALAALDAHIGGLLSDLHRPRVYKFVDAVPRTAAKRSKMQGEMRRQLAGIVLTEPSIAVNLSDVAAH